MRREAFGVTKKGESAWLYSLENRQGLKAQVTDYGAALVRMMVPDRDGRMRDVVLGYDDVSGYEEGTCFFGAAVGRCANRIGGGSFTLHGKTYLLTKNDNGVNTLHGGRNFTNQRLWEVEKEEEQKITFLLHSPDGDQGFPGAVDIRVTYELTDDDVLRIHYHGVPDQDTILNFTNHSYFNLDGHGEGNVLDQKVWIDADAYTRADRHSVPTGEIVPVEGTPMDFRTGQLIGARIGEDYEALNFGGGYDHNWVLNGSGLRRVAGMCSSRRGIGMEVYTDLPGMQFYTANFVEDEKGKEGAVYGRRQGACFETQFFPDAIHQESFPSPVVHAGEIYDTTTEYHFFKNS